MIGKTEIKRICFDRPKHLETIAMDQGALHCPIVLGAAQWLNIPRQIVSHSGLTNINDP
jgi:hypothetical protein